MARTFVDSVAVRKHVPLLLGLVGPSGGGKTFSALRLATGIQRLTGGDIVFVDTESSRALHYADNFKFRHVPFGAPFGPLDYVEVIDFCVERGASVVIIDSISHEWEGPGGVLEAHDRECERLMKAWKTTNRDKVQLAAWVKPKQEHRRMINTMLQLPCHFIFCFRAKKKLKVIRGQDPVELGWMPITSGDLIYEFAANILLPPGACGVPEWAPPEIGEREMVKRPGWATDILRTGRQLDESVGQELATWAAGTTARPYDEVLADMRVAATPGQLGALRSEARLLWGGLTESQKKVLGDEVKVATERVAATEAPEAEG